MIGLFCFALAILASPFRSKLRLEAENAALRHQLVVLRRQLKGRARLTNDDRWFFVQLYRWFPSILPALMIIRPETLVRWHRAGFRRYWRWQSRRRGGRPPIEAELRALIRQMSTENLLWGAPRIHGELLKLGFEVAQSSVAKYMVKRRGLPSQGWRTFLRNHAPEIAAMDLFVVPTIGFDLLYAFVIVRLDRRDLVWINVTTHPTAEWVARQIPEQGARGRRDAEELNRRRLARPPCFFLGPCLPQSFQPIQLDYTSHVLNLYGVGRRHRALAGSRIGTGVMLARRIVASVPGERSDDRQGLQPFGRALIFAHIERLPGGDGCVSGSVIVASVI
jgi:hypothetical protein